ncbi:imidazole glycerol phosphate synthase subunit HisF [Pseudogracilibacillus auburnensis]|uniref:Imidazole glycerol phosphate synthase subunit HisF n=1 Tax=Pseudogracilibacillus auburnensis TaxID=1494959 RepID=A0A2V3VX99_9BACI|nr:imidazole glycerol phosphate synthase subunit HisF [Pseudogracilibacillus auburnensis]MBO1002346.1 imidazole glycerol phosphate synthase subunit HisF [Pseudogracilibacillus auburnensis]PXW86266.1 imidazole glycerol phosphate synthase subunit HisF [Pseudogracilibacillus auburnensis]
MKKRIIPCLDVKDGRVVKGKKFQNIQDVAEPVELAKKYELDHADELFLLDITGTDRETFLQIVQDISAVINIPLFVGGGIRSVEDVAAVLQAGATKASITSAAIENPDLLQEAVVQFGKDKIILSIDAQQVAPNKWHAYTSGGKVDSGLDVIEWAKRGEEIGVSEILLNSIDADGVKDGYDLALNKAVTDAVDIPVIASGGAGEMNHFKTVLTDGGTNAALAASVFHYEEINITDLKEYLLNFDIPVEEI